MTREGGEGGRGEVGTGSVTQSIGRVTYLETEAEALVAMYPALFFLSFSFFLSSIAGLAWHWSQAERLFLTFIWISDIANGISYAPP